MDSPILILYQHIWKNLSENKGLIPLRGGDNDLDLLGDNEFPLDLGLLDLDLGDLSPGDLDLFLGDQYLGDLDLDLSLGDLDLNTLGGLTSLLGDLDFDLKGSDFDLDLTNLSLDLLLDQDLLGDKLCVNDLDLDRPLPRPLIRGLLDL